jgi:hypothetical protein
MPNEIQATPSPEILRYREAARERFGQELPQLLHDHVGWWVLYHGDRQVAIALHTGELHEVCLLQRLPLAEVMLFEIVAPDEEMHFGPMAFD